MLQINACGGETPSAISYEWQASNRFDLSPYSSNSVKLGKNGLTLNVSMDIERKFRCGRDVKTYLSTTGPNYFSLFSFLLQISLDNHS